MKRLDFWFGLSLSALVIIASWQQWLPIPMTEALGFVTGAACVYLVVQQSIWNFPLGIANNIFFLLLFGQARLFGDAGLLVVYIALGLHGWYQWRYGGEQRTALKITRASLGLGMVMVVAIAAMTVALVLILRAVSGSAPLLDAFTTALSLGAQYLLNRKVLENWFVWIVADVIYIYLYITRGLHLTAVLYGVFLCLCIAGLIQWRRALRREEAAAYA
ncbi:MAG TPA: nicotinamide riboside transporter PnuC [Blastocatellia bacterium]|nr:nicotinamide riboside transporter PnuC [Blastocatellia bacterium]